MKKIAKASLKTSFHQWSSLKMQLIWAYSGDVPGYLRKLEVDHRQGHWLWLMREGEVSLKAGDRTWQARKGQWILCPSGQLLQNFTDDANILSVHFMCQWPTGEPVMAANDSIVLEAREHPRLTKSAEALVRLTRRHFPGVRVMMFGQSSSFESFLGVHWRFVALLSELVAALDMENRSVSYTWPNDRRAARAVQLLNESPLSEPLPLERILKISGLSRVHLDRLLCTQLGFSIREYWDHLRESAACYHLENTEQTTKEISYHLGFKQPSHFTTWFKRRKHVTPEAYRAETNTRLLG